MAMTLRGEPMDGRPLIRHLPAGSPKPGSIAERLFKQHQRVQADTNRRLAHRAELQKSDLLTEAGKKRQGLDFSLGIAGENIKGRRDLEKFEREIAAKRSKIVMPEADRSDAVAAMRRFRKLDRLQAMSPEDRHKHVMKNKDDPELLIALLQAREDHEDIGISETLLGTIVDDVKKKLNGPLLEELEYDEKLADSVRSALDAEFGDIQKEAVAVDPSYADPDRLHARVAEVAALADPVWLKKFNEDGVEVIRAVKWAPDGKSGSWAKATPEEIETGLLAETRDEFDSLRAAPPLGASGTGDEGRKARADFIRQTRN